MVEIKMILKQNVFWNCCTWIQTSTALRNDERKYLTGNAIWLATEITVIYHAVLLQSHANDRVLHQFLVCFLLFGLYVICNKSSINALSALLTTVDGVRRTGFLSLLAYKWLFQIWLCVHFISCLILILISWGNW